MKRTACNRKDKKEIKEENEKKEKNEEDRPSHGLAIRVVLKKNRI